MRRRTPNTSGFICEMLSLWLQYALLRMYLNMRRTRRRGYPRHLCTYQYFASNLHQHYLFTPCRHLIAGMLLHARALPCTSDPILRYCTSHTIAIIIIIIKKDDDDHEGEEY